MQSLQPSVMSAESRTVRPPPSFTHSRIGVSPEDALAAKVPSSDIDASGCRRVCVIGAGAAGMSAAWSLSRHPNRFEVEVWEAASVPGGVATSIALKIHKDGTAAAYDPTDSEASPHMPRPGTKEAPSHTEQTSSPEWTWINDGVQGSQYIEESATLLDDKLSTEQPALFCSSSVSSISQHS